MPHCPSSCSSITGKAKTWTWGEKGSEKWKYHKVNAADLDEVIGLVQAKGAELIGMLLLAYGYSRPPKAGQPDSETEPISMEEVQ